MYQVSGQADWFKGQETTPADDYSCGSVVTVDRETNHLQVQGYEVHSTTHYLVVTTLQCTLCSAHCAP
jgi:hypothetical protein